MTVHDWSHDEFPESTATAEGVREIDGGPAGGRHLFIQLDLTYAVKDGRPLRVAVIGSGLGDHLSRQLRPGDLPPGRVRPGLRFPPSGQSDLQQPDHHRGTGKGPGDPEIAVLGERLVAM